MPQTRFAYLVMTLFAACAVSPNIPEGDSGYQYSVNEDMVDLFPADRVPFGVIFYLYDQPTGVSSAGEEVATLFTEMDGFRVRVSVEAGDSRLTVARRLARAFEFKGVECHVHPGGDWIACVSPHGEDVQSVGMQCLDSGMSIGFDYMKD